MNARAAINAIAAQSTAEVCTLYWNVSGYRRCGSARLLFNHTGEQKQQDGKVLYALTVSQPDPKLQAGRLNCQ